MPSTYLTRRTSGALSENFYRAKIFPFLITNVVSLAIHPPSPPHFLFSVSLPVYLPACEFVCPSFRPFSRTPALTSARLFVRSSLPPFPSLTLHRSIYLSVFRLQLHQFTLITSDRLCCCSPHLNLGTCG